MSLQGCHSRRQRGGGAPPPIGVTSRAKSGRRRPMAHAGVTNPFHSLRLGEAPSPFHEYVPQARPCGRAPSQQDSEAVPGPQGRLIPHPRQPQQHAAQVMRQRNLTRDTNSGITDGSRRWTVLQQLLPLGHHGRYIHRQREALAQILDVLLVARRTHEQQLDVRTSVPRH